MPKRRRVFSQTSTPRFRGKMYDYLSRGGRIPSFIATEVADAVTAEWAGNFGAFREFKVRNVFPVLDNLDIPYIIRGIIVGQAMKVKKKFGDNPSENSIRLIAKEVGFDRIRVDNVSLEDILLAIFGKKTITKTVTEGGARTEEVRQTA